MEITMIMISELNRRTGAGMLASKDALVEARGDIDKAIEILKARNTEVSEKYQDGNSNNGQETVNEEIKVTVTNEAGLSQLVGPKKIVISSQCIACGLCFNNPYIEENVDGRALTKGTGIIDINDEHAIIAVMNECPVGAISLEKVVSKSKGDIINQMKGDIEKFKLPEITIEDISFEKKHMDIQAPVGVPGQYRYEYSSYNRAKEAAKSAIDRAMFSQRKVILQNVINTYSMDKLSPYLEYREIENNFYYRANRSAQGILDGWIQDIQAYKPNSKIRKELQIIQTRPNVQKDYSVEFIKKYLFDYADVILKELSSDTYSLSSYVDYCDIDDQEEYAGTGMFGRTKYVTKYCFYNTDKAFEEMKKDLISACNWSFTDVVIERGALGNINYIIKSYSKLLQDELKAKAGELSKYV